MRDRCRHTSLPLDFLPECVGIGAGKTWHCLLSALRAYFLVRTNRQPRLYTSVKDPVPLLRSLIRSIIILAVFVPFAASLPLAAVSLCRTPEGAQCLFWLGPFSAGFYCLIYSQLSSAPWRRGAEAVRRWRAANGGMACTVGRATAWLFGGILFSYAAEAGFLFLARSAAWLPVATYSPLAFAWLWRRVHG